MTKNYKIYSLVNFKRICFIFKGFLFIWKLCKIICTKVKSQLPKILFENDDLNFV